MNEFKEKIEKFFNEDGKIKLFIIIGIAAVLLILLSESAPIKKEEKKYGDASSMNSYLSNIESDTQALISSINGVGRCKVMITFKNSAENVYAENTDENNSQSSNSSKNEYVLYDGQEGESPVLVKQYYPEVMGVAVVCDGAEVTAVRESVINAVSSLFNIPVTKISVSKYKG